MRDGATVTSPYVYRYDGTFAGFLCCVGECFHDKRLPQAIEPIDEPQATLFPVKVVDTDMALADRIAESVKRKISLQVFEMTRNAFLTCMEEKELRMVRFLLLGWKHGPSVTKLSANEDVYRMEKALKYLQNEAHYHVEFLRFSDLGELLAAEITPNNNVLPLIAPHFCDRFPEENMMIYDKNHKLGFLYRPGTHGEFFQADKIELLPPSEEEAAYQELWKQFYRAIAIEGRRNERLRMTLLHKRYWKNMVEMQEYLD